MDFSSFEISSEDLKYIADMVYDNSGIVFRDSNLSVLKSRLSFKLKEKNLTSHDYLKLLKNDRHELLSFIDFVTTNFTSFFRNPKQFEILKQIVLPDLINRNKNEKFVKLWSAGCATGEEPYTMMMITFRFFEENGLFQDNWSFFIVASDISLESLFIAREGKFPEKSVQKIEPYYFEKFFIKLDDHYQIKEEYKKWVKFDYHNLIYDNGIRDIDVAFCRNVLIYFDEDIQKKVIYNIYESMKEKGYLFLGHSESLIGLFNGFKPVSSEKGIYYVRAKG